MGKKMDSEFGWNGLEYMGDSTIILASSGIHYFNIPNGKGWDYTMETGKNDYTAAIAESAVGLALAFSPVLDLFPLNTAFFMEFVLLFMWMINAFFLPL